MKTKNLLEFGFHVNNQNCNKVYWLADKALYEAKENGRNNVVYKTI